MGPLKDLIYLKHDGKPPGPKREETVNAGKPVKKLLQYSKGETIVTWANKGPKEQQRLYKVVRFGIYSGGRADQIG